MVVMIRRASPGGAGMRWHPYSSVASIPKFCVSVFFHDPCGSFHIFLRVFVSMLLIYIRFV